MIQEVQDSLKKTLFVYMDKQGQPYECCPTAIRPNVSETTINTCLGIINKINVNFYFGLFCYDGAIHFEIDKSPQHFVNFSIKDEQCITMCSQFQDEWVEHECGCELEWIIDHTNSVFA